MEQLRNWTDRKRRVWSLCTIALATVLLLVAYDERFSSVVRGVAAISLIAVTIIGVGMSMLAFRARNRSDQ
jgi:multisubunit Na+/H+ antiporter MnhB subunit